MLWLHGLPLPSTLGFIDIEFKRVRKFTTGEPIIVVKEGRITNRQQRKVILTFLLVQKYPTSTEVVSDGIINTKNLSRLNLDEDWVKKQLKIASVRFIG